MAAFADPTSLLADLATPYWRILVTRAPQTAVDRLTRDIRSGRFGIEGLRKRARDLCAHTRGDVRQRARLELLPALGMVDDGLDDSTRFD